MLQRCRPQAEKIWEILSAIHLKLCGFFDGDGRYEGLCQPVLCLVCQQQERGTLLSQLPRRSRPAIALRHSTASKISSYALAAFEKDAASDVTTTVFTACIGYLITYAGKSLGEKMSRNKHHLDADGNPILDEPPAPDDEIHTDQ